MKFSTPSFYKFKFTVHYKMFSRKKFAALRSSGKVFHNLGPAAKKLLNLSPYRCSNLCEGLPKILFLCNVNGETLYHLRRDQTGTLELNHFLLCKQVVEFYRGCGHVR